MKKIIFIGMCCILCLCGCTNNQKANFDYTNKEQYRYLKLVFRCSI